MYVTVTTYDASDFAQFDDSTTVIADDQKNILSAVDGVENTVIVHLGGRTIDLGHTRTQFTTSPIHDDSTGSIDLEPADNVLNLAGTQYHFGSEINFTITFSGNLDGISNFTFDGVTRPRNGGTGSFAFALAGSTGGFGDSMHVDFTVDGSTSLLARTLQVAVSDTAASGYTIQDLSATNLTIWNYNGTLLVSNYANGNTGFWHSRFYFWNYDSTASSILVRLFTLPTDGTTSQLVGGAQLVFAFPIQASSGLTVKLEEILNELGVTWPYPGG